MIAYKIIEKNLGIALTPYFPVATPTQGNFVIQSQTPGLDGRYFDDNGDIVIDIDRGITDPTQRKHLAITINYQDTNNFLILLNEGITGEDLTTWTNFEVVFYNRFTDDIVNDIVGKNFEGAILFCNKNNVSSNDSFSYLMVNPLNTRGRVILFQNGINVQEVYFPYDTGATLSGGDIYLLRSICQINIDANNNEILNLDVEIIKTGYGNVTLPTPQYIMQRRNVLSNFNLNQISPPPAPRNFGFCCGWPGTLTNTTPLTVDFDSFMIIRRF